MPKFNPLPKVKSLRFGMDQQQQSVMPVDMQSLCNSMAQLERKLNALQAENTALRAQSAPRAEANLFKIPDPIKGLPSFDGNRKQLQSWIQTVKKILDSFKPLVSTEVFSMYEQMVLNKIDGRARDTICVNGNPTSFEEASEILLSIYGDKNDMSSYQAQLWSLKMEDSLHIYYKKTKEIIQNMKSLAKQKALYRNHWEAINDFLDSECLAAFINGLNKNYFGYAQAANPEDIESAYAFLCKFKNAETTQKQLHQSSQNKPSNTQYQNKFQNHRQNKPFNNNTSDRTKVTPMEVDPSIRSKQARLFNHNTHPVEDENEVNENSDSEYEQECDANFQIAPNKKEPK